MRGEAEAGPILAEKPSGAGDVGFPALLAASGPPPVPQVPVKPSWATQAIPPERVLPVALALFGAVAGLFAILAVGAFRPAAREVLPLAPLLSTAAVGAIAGLVLAALQRTGRELPTEVIVVRTGATSVVGGALSGGLVALFTWGLDGVPRFVMGGALVGLLFQPGCHAVFRASVKAARARNGSLVADADRRTVVSTLIAGAALLSVTQVPALLSVSTSTYLHPLVQAGASLLVCACAVVVIVRLRKGDARGRAALDGASEGATWLESVEEARVVAPDAVDLGLGDQHFAQVAGGGYRSMAGEVKLRGSVADAARAFDEADRARHYALLCAAFALVQVGGVVLLRVTDLFPVVIL